MSKNKFEMTMNLNVLNHLGIRLYSNIPAVISEVVSNAWDADAENVKIEIKDGLITIIDDGHGMTIEDINKRYLNVGYERRKDEDHAITPKHKRKVMGRKGIGKLSLFSIAETVELQTMREGGKNGFLMESQEIKKQIESGNAKYFPKEISSENLAIKSNGTIIILRGLKKSIGRAEDALVKRLARRFSVIGDENKFKVSVNDKPIAVTDRDYFHKLQYLWYFGKESESYVKLCKKDRLQNSEKRNNTLTGGHIVKGWIGSVETSGDLKDGDDNLNKIVIMVRGKLAQEDILEDFADGGMYTKYLIGEIHADFLDDDDKEDIATSSRQKIIEDDDRYIQLKSWIREELKNIQRSWTDLRNESGKKKALENKAIKNWFEGLKGDNKKQAEQLFGKINQLTLSDESQRKELFKHGVLAFESLRYKNNLSALESVSVDNIKEFSQIFSNLDDIEATLYHQIIRERIQVIDVLHNRTAENALEKVIQKHLYEHLWLLDPSWDRATETPSMEKNVTAEFAKIDAKLSKDEKKARFDIKYKKSSGKHIIIELKRPDIALHTTDLIKQIDKYRNALGKLLEKSNLDEPIEVICIVGKDLKDWTSASAKKESIKMQEQKNMRTVLYNELVESAYKTYERFLEKNKEAGRVFKLIKEIDDN